MSDRAEFEEARRHGLEARHETRVERAIRRQVAEEIAAAIEAKQEWFRGHCQPYTADGLSVAALIAREHATPLEDQ